MPRLAPRPEGERSKGGGAIVPAGDYVIVLVWFKRAVAKSGRDYLRAKFEICSGPLSGRAFYVNLGLAIDTTGGAARWQILMEVCGVEEEIELGATEEGTEAEGDATIERFFRYKPFKARISCKKRGGYTNNDLEMVHYLRTYTEADREAIKEWLRKQLEGGGDYGAAEDDDPDYTPTPKGGDDSPIDDDDIPF